MIQSLADKLLGVLFPDRCVGCGNLGDLLCSACRATLRPLPHPPRSLTHVRADGNDVSLNETRAAYVFEGPLREAIHALKYDRVKRIAPILGDLLSDYLQTHAMPIGAIIPVPLHKQRLAERGFNQSELVAQRLAETCGKPLLVKGLFRKRDTAHQVGLDAQERKQNMYNAFVWRGSSAPPPRVLLIDDVLTTGATLNACAQALKAAGSREVRALTLAQSASDNRTK